MSPSAPNSPEDLQSRFGLSRRLAARVGSLESLGLGTDEPLLAAVSGTPALESFLLSPELFTAVEMGDWARAASLAVESGQGLACRKSAGGHVLVRETRTGDFEDEPALPAAPGALRSQVQLVSDLVEAGLSQGLREVMLTFLTSPDPLKRLEALRRVLLDSLDPALTSAVLYHALRDPDRTVALEAVKAMGSLGLSPESAEAFTELINAPAGTAGRLLSEIQERVDSLGDLEVTVLLVFIVRLFRDPAYQDLKDRLLDMFRSLLRRSPGATRDISAFLRLLLRHLPFHLEKTHRPGRELMLDLFTLAPDQVLPHIWSSIKASGSQTERRFLVHLLTQAPLEEKDLKRLDAWILEHEIAEHLHRGEDVPPYFDYMTRRWRPIVPVLLDQAENLPDERNSMLLKIAASILARVTGGSVTALLRRCLDLAETSQTGAKMALLRSGAHRRDGMPKTLRERFSRIFLSLLQTEFLPEYNVEIYDGLRELGFDAVNPLLDFIAQEIHDQRLRREIIEILDSRLADPVEVGGTSSKAVRTVFRRVETLCRKGDLSVSIHLAGLMEGMVSNSAVDEEEALNLAGRCLERIRRSDCTPTDVALASAVCGAARVSDEMKKEAGRRLIKILDQDSNEQVAEETGTGEDRVLSARSGTDVHTILIPSAIQGLKRIARTMEGDLGFSYMISRFLMRKVEETTSLAVVWSLGNRKRLLQALSEISVSEDTPPSLRSEILVFLGRLFWEDPDEFSVIEILAETLRAGTFPGTEKAVAAIVRKLLETGHDAVNLGGGDGAPYLCAVATMVQGPNLPSPKSADLALLLDLLEKEARRGSESSLAAVKALADSVRLPASVLKQVEALLADRRLDEGAGGS